MKNLLAKVSIKLVRELFVHSLRTGNTVIYEKWKRRVFQMWI